MKKPAKLPKKRVSRIVLDFDNKGLANALMARLVEECRTKPTKTVKMRSGS